MGNAQSAEDKKQRKREQKELAAATARLALSYGHSSLAEAYIEQVVTDRTSDAARVQNALLRSKVEEDSRQEQEIYRSSRRGASERSSRAVERTGGLGSRARSRSSGASTSAVEHPSSQGQDATPAWTPNRHSSAAGRHRLQTTSLDSMVSGASALTHRDGSKTSAFLARAESVLASQKRPDSEPLTPSQRGLSVSGRRNKAASLRQQEEDELQMALAVSASEAASVAAALQEPISIEDAEAIAAAQAELDAASEASNNKPRRSSSMPVAQRSHAEPEIAVSSSAAPGAPETAAAGAPVPMRERFVPLTAAQKADIEATEVKDRIQRSRSAAAAAAKFQFIADDQAQEERRVASPERWEPEPLPGPSPSKHRLRAEAFAAKLELSQAPDTPATPDKTPSIRVASTASFSSSQPSEATSLESLELPPRAVAARSGAAAGRRARAFQGLPPPEHPSLRVLGSESMDSEADRAVLEYLQRQPGELQSRLDAPRSVRTAALRSKSLAHHGSMPTHHEPPERSATMPRAARRLVQ